MNVWWTAFIWIALALAASLVSVRLALSVALAEILFGVLGGNVLHIQPNEWINFLAGLGGVLLTFLAGAEIEPEAMRQHWKAALAIGFVSFLVPFLGAMAYVYYVAGWEPNAAKIAGVALSTTSVAVVYAVMIETGMNRTSLGKLILAACFVTDLGTVVALGLLFAEANIWLLVFVIVLAVTLAIAPGLTRWFFRMVSAHTSEPQIKFILLLLLMLGSLAVKAKSEAVLGAYLLGLVLAGTMAKNRDCMHRIRTMTFTLLTPFYFLKAGSYISLPALWGAAGLISILLVVKIAAKGGGLLSAVPGVSNAPPRGNLRHPADEHGLNLRYHLCTVRSDARIHHPVAVHRTGDGGDWQCAGTHHHCTDLLQTGGGGRGREGERTCNATASQCGL
jgi:Kef-type K+ transport system membrane component KefB